MPAALAAIHAMLCLPTRNPQNPQNPQELLKANANAEFEADRAESEARALAEALDRANKARGGAQNSARGNESPAARG